MSLLVVFVAACGIALVSAGSSLTSVSKPHEGKFDYKIDHHYHGDWHGSAYPHGYGGLGDGHGSYGLGGAEALGLLPQGGYGGHYSAYNGGYENHGAGYGHGYAGNGVGYGLNYGTHGYGHGAYGHGASSYQNSNLKSHGGFGGYSHDW